jgi:hypothetical protein
MHPLFVMERLLLRSCLLLRRLGDDGEVMEHLLLRPLSVALVLLLGVLLWWLDDDGEVNGSGAGSFGLAATTSSTSR